ncbi:hypothetical protein JW758_06210 [Candidatus Peregrinibacteria bacterium]|nr:hypothetical protein [Candidatus Peregrinibacteria bacterium]
MADTGDFELFTGPAPKEAGEDSDEKFSEEMRKTQQALAQLYKEEGQARASDHDLALILVHFLSQPENTDLFLLISRSLAQDIPSELILAVISLIDKKASDKVIGFLETTEGQTSETKALTIADRKDFKSLSPELKKHIDGWIKLINQVAVKKPHRSLESLIIKKRSSNPEDNGKLVREISPSLVQLASFVLRNFLSAQKIEHEFDQLQAFIQEVFVNLVRHLEELVEEQKKIN